ncbi:hypothetical protein TELCIR_10597 [Teladorsagia circumcincta]|uniref:SXP/RAL-2 family protein Ani s 5-like cation-binding domain-containing protein n=1 Tax=Teladorsagia circumcincta TaxID=45464 RepID=A0A2G9UBP8_TELCI|nr:hypothetical protein TELCIR_10597 [Teladorsagia circumcincta]
MKTALIVFVFAAVVASSTAWRHRRGHHHHHRPPPPPYLKNVSAEARREYRKIVRNDTLTVAEQKKEINEWAKKYNIAKQVKEFDEKMNAHMKEVKANVTKLIQYLPEALEKFSRIVEDENLTPKQIGERRHNLTATYPEAYHVLKFVFKQFMPRHGPHGPHGPHGGRHHGHHGGRRDDDDDTCCPMGSDDNNGKNTKDT